MVNRIGIVDVVVVKTFESTLQRIGQLVIVAVAAAVVVVGMIGGMILIKRE